MRARVALWRERAPLDEKNSFTQLAPLEQHREDATSVVFGYIELSFKPS